MSPNAQKIMSDLAEQYVAAQYPGRESFMFQPEAHEEVAFNELRARGYIERYTSDHYCFTYAGHEWVLDRAGTSEKTLNVVREIARLYVEAGYPEVGCWSFGHDGEDEAAFGELRDRGLIERFTADHWRLTDYGLRVIMEKFAA